MTRSRKIMLGAALALALAASVPAALGWVVSTTAGSRGLLNSLAAWSGVGFTAAGMEGRLLDRLLLTGVRISAPGREVRIDSLELRWRPLLLPAGRIAVRELSLKGVRIRDDSPVAEPTAPSWPKAPPLARFLTGRIERLLVTDLEYRRLKEEPVTVGRVAGAVAWRGSILSVSDLKVLSPSGELSGAFSAGFGRPSLTADLAIAPALPVSGMDRFSLRVLPAKGGSVFGDFVGAVAVSGGTGARKLLDLSGEVAMARKAFRLRGLRLSAPERKGVLTADGSLEFAAKEPLLSLQVRATGLDLSPELNLPTDLSGTLIFAGTAESYRGSLTLANKAEGWRSALLSSPYRGDRHGLKMAPFSGTLLGGALAGNLDLDWRGGFALSGAVSGRNLNPAAVDPRWKGSANFRAEGRAAWPEQGPATGRVSGRLLDSTLHGKALTGELLADFAGEDVSVARLELRGEGFDLRASGRLNRGLDLAARIDDFSRIVPGSAGTLRAAGRVRLSDGELSGALSGTGSRLAYGGTRIAAADLSVGLDPGPGHPLHFAATLRDAVQGNYKADTVTLAADGTLARHLASATLASGAARARLELAAGYGSGIWKGEIRRLEGRDGNGAWRLAAPAAFSAGGDEFHLAPLAIAAGASERLELAADLGLTPLSGGVRARWTGVNLARANPYLKEMRVTGSSRGDLRLGFVSEKRLTLAGSAAGSGTFTAAGRTVTLTRGAATLDGGERGVRIGVDVGTADGGALKGTFYSPAPLGPELPAQGELSAEATGLDLALIRPWLPAGVTLEGRGGARAKGNLLPDRRFELSGDAALSAGTLRRESPEGAMKLAFSAATAAWTWRDQALDGDVSLTMTEYGRARAKLRLPLAARFPVALDPKGALRGSLTGQVRENGILAALFPGSVRESFGELRADLEVDGTWETPILGGTLRLAKGGAYLPAAGIRLKDVALAARLEGNLIRIDSYRAVSGAGHIEGTALLTLSGRRLIGYRGTVRGENFQTVFLPEFRMLSTPDLTFEGSPGKVALRGELRIPELRLVGARSRAGVAPSGDVVREGRAAKVAEVPPLAADVSVRVLLGERVFVKAAGIDARLDGALHVSGGSLDRITSTGEIRVAKGNYRTYGVDLDIARGRLFFAGGPVDRPAIDFLALRTAGEVRAGVKVSGTLQRPITKLYSEPPMPDVDILAYIVLGHPMGGSGEQASLVAQAAGALLTSGQAAALQDQIKNRLGLSTLEIKGGVGGATGFMGYKPLQVTAPGAVPAEQQAGVTETVLTVGKFLTPKLYVSYGKSIFTGSNLFRMRYDILGKWQIETQAGDESGADLFYKLEFK